MFTYIFVLYFLGITSYTNCVDIRYVTEHENLGLLPAQCGSNIADRIIGGNEASLGQYPWMARLGYQIDKCSPIILYTCAGALITNKFVITAAHCIDSLPLVTCSLTQKKELYIVKHIRLGENFAHSVVDCEDDVCADPVQDIGVEKKIVHSEFNKNYFNNDIALVKLKRAAIYNGWVMPLCLPTLRSQLTRDYVDSYSEIAGWGMFNTSNPAESNKLLYTRVPIISMRKCLMTYTSYFQISTVHQFCAGGQAEKDSCGGDSGGPMVQVSAAYGLPRYYALGIVSYGPKKCGEKDKPAVYTNIVSYMDWVLDNLEA